MDFCHNIAAKCFQSSQKLVKRSDHTVFVCLCWKLGIFIFKVFSLLCYAHFRPSSSIYYVLKELLLTPYFSLISGCL